MDISSKLHEIDQKLAVFAGSFDAIKAELASDNPKFELSSGTVLVGADALEILTILDAAAQMLAELIMMLRRDLETHVN